MTSSNGIIFRVTGHLWGESNGPPHRGQWRGALIFSSICAMNKRVIKQAGNLRRHRAHHDVIVMLKRASGVGFLTLMTQAELVFFRVSIAHSGTFGLPCYSEICQPCGRPLVVRDNRLIEYDKKMNTLSSEQNMADILKTTFSNAFFSKKLLCFHFDFTEVCSQGSNHLKGMSSFWRNFLQWLHRKLTFFNIHSGQWRKFRQNYNISILVVDIKSALFRVMACRRTVAKPLSEQ